MVSGPANALTKLGFRRDIKLFLTVLVGFLAAIIVMLIVQLQWNLLQMQDTMNEQWTVIADSAAASLSNAPGAIPVEDRLELLRASYGIVAIDYIPIGGGSMRSGKIPREHADITRSVPGGKAIFRFDSSRLRAARQRLHLTATICAVAAAGGILFLILYLPTILRPIEEMLDHAREVGAPGSEHKDEAQFLIETFRNSIATLRAQEAQLQQLHEAEKLRADELQLVTATLTRSLTSGFIAINTDERIVDMNAAARDILRVPPDAEHAGATLLEALGDTPFARLLDDAVAHRRTLTRFEVVHAAHADNDQQLILGLSTVPLFNDGGGFLGVLVLFTDLSPVRSLEARLRELQALAELGEISAGIAHEFRNSLSTILGWLKLARRQQLEKEVESKLRSAEDEAVLLSQAVDGLLAFARPMRVDLQPVDLTELVRSVAERLSPLSNGAEVELRGEQITVEADPALLTRALENVIRNAIESVQQKGGGTVVIETTTTPSPTISVRDTGVGLDPANAARFFRPFHSEKPSGLGLGLPLARKIVLLHGGDIRLSGREAEGATVTIEFPREVEALRPAMSPV